MAVLCLVVTSSLQGLAHAQAESDEVPVILLHPGVPTTLRLPEEIEQARILDRGEVRLAIVRDTLYLRPWPGTRAGTRAVLEVKSRTVLRRIPVRVVRHAREAHFALQMGPAGRLDRFQAPPEFPRVGLLRPPILFQEPPAPATPPVSVTALAPGPAVPKTRGEHEPAERLIPDGTAILRDPHPEISVHVVGALGFTGLDPAGHLPTSARHPFAGLGARLMLTRPGARWALEANVSGEWPRGPMSFEDNRNRSSTNIEGPWLRAELCTRARLGGTKWNPSAQVGLGVQAHLRRTEATLGTRSVSETMPQGAVLVLGIGLERRTGHSLLGLEFQVRQGWPDGYHSVAVAWTLGRFLDPD